MDAVVIAQLDKPPDAPAANESDSQTSAPTRRPSPSSQVLKGEAAIGQQKTLDTVFFGEGQRGDKYLVTGIDPPDLTWSTPLKLNDASSSTCWISDDCRRTGANAWSFSSSTWRTLTPCSHAMRTTNSPAPRTRWSRNSNPTEPRPVAGVDQRSRKCRPAASGCTSRCWACAAIRMTCRMLEQRLRSTDPESRARTRCADRVLPDA